MPRQKKARSQHADPQEPLPKKAYREQPRSERQRPTATLPYLAAAKIRISGAYSLDMPEDFYDFWALCCEILPGNPLGALSCGGLELVGPFEELWKACQQSETSTSDGFCGNEINNGSDCSKVDYLTKWRFYYDVPEFQTVVIGDKSSQYHIGYFRDDPATAPAFVASNEASSNCELVILGDNLFAAAVASLSATLSLTKNGSKKADIKHIIALVTERAKENGFSLLKETGSMALRKKQVVSKCFHGAGIVVPVSKDGVGYRPIPESAAGLRRIFKDINEGNGQCKNAALDALQELVTYVQFANDECDYGEGLELGIDIFCYGGSELHSFVRHLLPMAYQLLGRPLFAQIIEAHLENRRQPLFV